VQGFAYAGIAAAIVTGGPVTSAVVQDGNVAVHSVATAKPDDTAVPNGQTISPRPHPVLDVGTPRPTVTRTIYLPRSSRPEPSPAAQPPLPVLRPTPVEDHQQPVPAAKSVRISAAPSGRPAEIQPKPTRRPARARRHRQPVSPPRSFRAAPPIQMPAAPPLQQAIPPLPAPVQQYPQPAAGLLPVQAAVPQVQLPEAAPLPEAIPVAPPLTPTPQPGQTPAISMLTTSELGMGHHASWAPVLGIAIAAEVALLWVAACLGMWRRRMAFSTGYALPHPVRTVAKMCRELRNARLPFRRRS
jgi:hypothetical protein